MRLFFAVIFGIMCFSGRGVAQEGDVGTATSALQDKNPRRARQITRLEEENFDLDNRTQTVSHRQKEKLKLMKMIYDSQQRQEPLHEAILEFQKNTPSESLSANSGYAK